MKINYKLWANKKTIKNLDLYTKLAGLFFFSLGLNFVGVFLYWKFIVQYEFSGLVLLLSILMFMLTPVVMLDPKKENRNLVATVSYGIFHGICTITSMLVTQFLIVSHCLYIWIICSNIYVVKKQTNKQQIEDFRNFLTNVFGSGWNSNTLIGSVVY